MKKVGIITIVDYCNYGNRLQNYAVQEVIKNLGLEPETIVNEPINIRNLQQKLKRFMNRPGKEMIIILVQKASAVMRKIRQLLIKTKDEKEHTAEKQRVEELIKDRETRFIKYTNENIKETPYSITPDTIPKDFYKNYSYFIVGSDQVWNPNFRLGSPIDFLTFAKPEQRIAYAASFGVSELSTEIMSDYRSWLAEMPHISVREEIGAGVVKELIGREVEVLIDPTLMLTREQWLSIAKKSIHKPDKPYLLTYFLGEIANDVKLIILEIAKEFDLEIVNLDDISDNKRFIVDPPEFLDYINSSDIFLTDSFHGAVFSILFKKTFIVFNRISKEPLMNSRIDTLLLKFELEERKWEKTKKLQTYYNVNYNHVEEILEQERRKSYDYLKCAFQIEHSCSEL